MSEKRLGMLIDLGVCIGCNACTVACKQENEPPLTKFNTWVESWDAEAEDGRVTRANLPKLCNHCENPACVSVCPTGASYKRDDGIVLVDHSKCVGCQYCVMACPYGVRTYDEAKDKGVIEKCTLCAHLVDDGKEPACVRHCPGQARVFGDADDPESKVSKLVAAKKTHKLTDVGNKPSVTFGLDKCEWKGGE